MKYYLDCPYDEKDEAKAMGAKWDKAVKKWFYESDTIDHRFDKWQGDDSETTKTAPKTYNLEKINNCVIEHAPFIVFDTETTGIMNGNDNRITQIAFAAYSYNENKERYEMQDHLFMLAKANVDVVRNIEQAEQPTDENIKKALENEFIYKLSSAVKKYEKGIAQCQSEILSINEQLDKGNCTQEELVQLQNKAEKIEKKVEKYTNFLNEVFPDDEHKEIVKSHAIGLDMCKEYIAKHYDEKKAFLTENIKIKELLLSQGIDMENWISSGEGLNPQEMQAGIIEFLNNNYNEETLLLCNGMYYANHYLSKEEMFLPKMIFSDVIKAAGEYNSEHQEAGSKIACNYKEFADLYKSSTGKEIKTFDAFTKALCLAELACKMTGSGLSHNSDKSVANSAKAEVLYNQTCTMDAEEASSLLWKPDEVPNFMKDNCIFDSLEYVNFGNDRKYVDIDRLFEIDENLEITLGGEKEPIKSWDELEAKIKSYNADISEELLNRIKGKYAEIETAVKQQTEKTDKTNEKGPDNDFLLELQRQLDNFDNRLSLISQQEKSITEDYNIVFEKAIKKINKELPAIAKFAIEVFGKIYPEKIAGIHVVISDNPNIIDRVDVKRKFEDHPIDQQPLITLSYAPETGGNCVPVKKAYLIDGIQGDYELLKKIVDNYSAFKENIEVTIGNMFSQHYEQRLDNIEKMKKNIKQIQSYLDKD